jgi:hypothetical protein
MRLQIIAGLDKREDHADKELKELRLVDLLDVLHT